MPISNSPPILSSSPAPVLIRAACKSSTSATTTSPLQFVLFRHPGYRDSLDLMLRLSALDRVTPSTLVGSGPTLLSERDPARLGIHHATALQACIIIACNEPGFLSPTKLATLPELSTRATALDLNSVLTEKSYWFYPFSWKLTDDPYPVCPDFENWSFPTEDIPHDWIAIVSFAAPYTWLYVCSLTLG